MIYNNKKILTQNLTQFSKGKKKEIMISLNATESKHKKEVINTIYKSKPVDSTGTPRCIYCFAIMKKSDKLDMSLVKSNFVNEPKFLLETISTETFVNVCPSPECIAKAYNEHRNLFLQALIKRAGLKRKIIGRKFSVIELSNSHGNTELNIESIKKYAISIAKEGICVIVSHRNHIAIVDNNRTDVILLTLNK